MLSSKPRLDRFLRVNHAGEYGAKRIYEGQLAVLGHSTIAQELRHMAAQEQHHLNTFDTMLTEKRVRPTVLHPLWHIAGFALGVGTALMGEKAAMACTVAVEEVIDEHYQQQIEQLEESDPLKATLEQFRQEELDHKDTAIAHGGKDAAAYPFMRQAIRMGSKTAIWLSERF
jgi:ubiquinone biosynthesis monooxygenase Coq7